MKSILKFVLTIMLFMALTIGVSASSGQLENAGAESIETTQLNQIKTTISNSLIYPSFAKEDNIEGDVWVKVQIDENGKLKVVQSNAMDDVLENYTRNKIESLKVDEPGKPAALYLQVTFRLL
jgi:outer membrane biosynthesis protein TonB